LLYEAIGDQAFKKAVRKYLENTLFKVKTQDFFDEVNKVSDFDTLNLVKYGLSLRYLIPLQPMSY
jgi:aminopeptidase N